MNSSLAYLVKCAARARQLARLGQLSQSAINTLRGRGMLPSPLQAGFGLHVGNMNIAKKHKIDIPEWWGKANEGQGSHGYMDFTPEPISGAGHLASPVAAMHPAQLRQLAAGKTGPWAMRMLMKLGPARRFIEEQAAAMERTSPGGMLISKVAPTDLSQMGRFRRWILGNTVIPHIYGGLSPTQMNQMGPLVARHEIDELREAAKAMRKGRSIGRNFYTHVSPEVIRREGANTALLDPAIAERMMNIRMPRESGVSPVYARRRQEAVGPLLERLRKMYPSLPPVDLSRIQNPPTPGKRPVWLDRLMKKGQADNRAAISLIKHAMKSVLPFPGQPAVEGA